MQRSWLLCAVPALVLVVVTAGCGTAATAPPLPSPEPLVRVSYDRPDDHANASQIHMVFAVPNDECLSAPQWDTDGTLARSVEAFEKWLAGQTGGRMLRVDTYHGQLDITFVCLKDSNEVIRTHDPIINVFIRRELAELGLADTYKIYAVYYGGTSSFACGGADWPPQFPGNAATMYLHGKVPYRNGTHIPCEQPFTDSKDRMGYWEFAMLHDILHVMGIVGQCAPHFAFPGHTGDDPTDLMYTGSQTWQPSVLDPGHDDYFGHHNPGCPDLAQSPFLTATQPAPE